MINRLEHALGLHRSGGSKACHDSNLVRLKEEQPEVGELEQATHVREASLVRRAR